VARATKVRLPHCIHVGPRSVRVSELAGRPRVWLDISFCEVMRGHMTRAEWIDWTEGLDQVRMPA
jgi:hypothetical protein